ncbi:hypothetical protein SCUCBS95973_000540 [Sporothrix curviconia]|uniref:Glycosyltransferase family 69 protein n=1 Tax=Sporothrix curviconia TaxID=1260050 RepID=A0ABP0AR40_9PEZI
MQSSAADDEHAAFLSSSGANTPPPFSLDDDPDPADGFASRGLLSSAEKKQLRQPRCWQSCCGLGHLAARCFLRRRSKRRLLGLALKCVFGFAVALLVLTPFLAPSYLHPPEHYNRLAAKCEALYAGPEDSISRMHGCANAFDEKVFISVSLYDKNGHLAGGEWGNTLIELVRLLGPSNVFVSIYENDSGRRGATALEHLRRLLPCRNAVVYDDHVPLNLFPNITMPDGTQHTKRLAYLAEMRNRALRPLDTLAGVGGTVFDRILFLNDVSFRAMDAAQLLFSTNVVDPVADGRAQYLSACALDYKTPLFFYDLYAQRDAEGFSNGLPIFPIFSHAGQGVSRADMLAQKDAVRVRSCWGGMVAMDARYIQHRNTSLPTASFQAIGHHVVDPVRPTGVSAPVRFRYEPEVFYDACECCLLQADIAQAARVAGAPASHTGVFVNPYIRVAYDATTLRRVRLAQRWERLLALPQAVISYWARLPTHNPHRQVREGDAFVEEVWSSRAKSWSLETRTGRNGMFCGVREMQVIDERPRTQDKNWANVAIPPGQALDFPN